MPGFTHLVAASLCLVVWVGTAGAQVDILSKNYNVEGPWSDIENTTLVVQKVANGSVVVDGVVNPSEYAGMEGITVSPENGYTLNWPGDREWDGPEDNQFTFSLVHDDHFVYFGVVVVDDVMNADAEGSTVWKDDSIEFRFDHRALGFDVNFDSARSPYGGVCKVTGEGRFSEWDYETDTMLFETSRFATAFEAEGAEPWTLAEEGDVWSAGTQGDGTWSIELKLHKRLFEDPDFGNELENDGIMRFNIGINDDDARGSEGPNGSGLRERDMEVQYHWANRFRPSGWNQDVMDEFAFTLDEVRDGSYLNFFDLVINADGRLTPGGWGELVFSSEVTTVRQWALY